MFLFWVEVMLMLSQLRRIRLIPRTHAILKHVQKHRTHRYRDVPTIPTPHNPRHPAQRKQRHRPLHNNRNRLALRQIPRTRSRRRRTRLSLRKKPPPSHGRTNIPRTLPQDSNVTTECSALSMDDLYAVDLSQT